MSTRPLALRPPAPDRKVRAAPISTNVPAAAFRWGLWTGVVAGAATGTMIFPVYGTVLGAFYGLLAAVVPATIGAAAVAVIARRQPMPFSVDGFAGDLARLFATMITVLFLGVAAYAGVTGLVYDLGATFAWPFGVIGLLAVATAVTWAVLRQANHSLTHRMAVAKGWR